jgi:arylsulfatase
LAERFTANGYLAYHIGKWHVNADASATAVGPFENWPLQRGYNRAHWFQGHSLNYFRPSNVFDGNQRVDVEGDDYFATDAFTENAIRYLREHKVQAAEQPFFLTLAYGAAHSPLHAPEADIAAQRGRYDSGWDEIRAQRLQRQIELGVVATGTQLPPRNNGVTAWSDLTADQQRLYARYMEVYAAVLKRADENIGRLVATLAEIGELENTIIVLFSDNGGSPDGGLTGTPNLLASSGVPLADALAQIDRIGSRDTYPMYPMGWAMASNTPYKMYKHDTHLGGVADPLIVHWPLGIAASGEVRPQYVHVCDIFPTLVACAEASRAGAQHREMKAVQGVDFSSTFARSDAPETRTEQHFELNGTRALYSGGWRLVSKGRFQQPGDGWELYDLSQACNELTDIAAINPQKVAQLEARWIAAAHRYDVFPIDTRTIREKSWAPLLREQHRARWVLAPPLDILLEEAAPPLVGRSHTVEIVLSRPLRRGDSGVLYAGGNMYLGSALYIQNGRIVHEFSAVPRSFRTEAPAPVGATRIVVRHQLTARPWQGAVELIAGEERLTLAHHEPLFFGRPMQGFQVGRNGSTPASLAYQNPFAFTGEIVSLVVEVDPSAYTPEEIATVMRLRRG